MDGCLSENVVAALVSGRLPRVELESAERHLDRCGGCRELVTCALSATGPARPAPADVRCIGRYRVLREVGAGSMGTVYAAEDPDLGREVAIKVLRPTARDDESLRIRLAREARAMARLSHPNVITVHEIGAADDQLFIAMELVAGATFRRWLRDAPRGWRATAEVMCAAGRGLAAAHAAGVVHRDFKPDNVLVGEDGRVRVTDFGLAHLAAASVRAPEGTTSAARGGAPALALTALTVTGALVGTPAYMAPEQLRGEPADERSDLFSFCVAFWEALYGERPFAGRDLDEFRAAVFAGEVRVPPEGRDVPASLHAAILRGLQPARGDRPASMAELLAEIDAAAAAGPVRERGGRDDAGSRSATTRVHAPRRRRTAFGAALALGAGALAVAILPTAHTGDPPCDAGRLDGIWDAEVKARFAGASGPGVGRWASILRTIDTHMSEWIALREAACRKGSRIAENCLDQQLQQLRGVLAGLDVRDPKTAENAVYLLPKPSICADPGYLDALAAALAPTVRHSPGGLVPLAISFGGRASDIIHAALEVDGDLVIAGSVSSGANFFGTRVDLSSTAWRAGFLARIGDHGDVRWRWVLERVQVMAIAPVPGGDAVIAGYDAVGEAPSMTALPMIDAGADCFVARIDLATGETRWRRTCGATKYAAVRGIAADPEGNVYVAGDFRGRARFGGTAWHDAEGAPTAAPFVASWSGDGALRWVTAGRGTTESRTHGVAVRGDAVVVGGSVEGAGRLGDRALATGGCVIARLDRASGAIRWLREEQGPTRRCRVYAVAISGDRIGAGGRGAREDDGAWVAELDLDDGDLRWRRVLGSGTETRAKSVDYSPEGDLMAGGRFIDDVIRIDDVVLENHGRVADAFVLRFDGHGRCLAGLGFGGASDDGVRWLGYGSTGRLFVAGRFEAGMTVGEQELARPVGADAFLLELSPTLAAPRGR
ncbi:MAG TPA: protein kinase [Kofleriaceae bacterium]|nr:protein kinase [Kofleriaceae bacterium]